MVSRKVVLRAWLCNWHVADTDREPHIGIPVFQVVSYYRVVIFGAWNLELKILLEV